MAHNIDDFLTADQISRKNLADQKGIGADFVQDLADRDLLNFGDQDPTAFSVGNARANRASALKQLSIQRKKLEFQKKTGLRDIGQARAKGLKGAINNALQRGIFNSGIRIENEKEWLCLSRCLE